MTTRLRPRRRVLAFLSAAAAAATLSGAILSAAPAAGVAVTGRGIGYESQYGAWIGSYRLADGSSGFCVNLGRSSPIGADFTPTDAATLGWYGADDRARLAYIGRTWATTGDADTAAAAQFLTWKITGFDGRTPGELLARAGSAAARVQALAERLSAETEENASRGVTGSVTIASDPDGVTRVRADLDVDRLRGVERLADGAATGVIRLTGAHFEDGSTARSAANGASLAVIPTGDTALVEVRAEAEFDDLPFGGGAVVGFSPADVQNLLIASPAQVSATAAATVERPSESPFQPRVTTAVSSATAAVGDQVHDVLRVDAAPRPADDDDVPAADPAEDAAADAAGEAARPAPDGESAPKPASGAWGVIPDGEGYRPIPAVVTSRLLGPLSAAPQEAAEPPDGARVACEVTTPITSGPGEYTTPPCQLHDPGYYVWVDAIDPQDTPATQGGTRMLPWHSRFGVASEVVQVIAPAPAAEQPPTAATPALTLAETGTAAAVPVAALLALGAMATGILALRRTRRLSSLSRSGRS